MTECQHTGRHLHCNICGGAPCADCFGSIAPSPGAFGMKRDPNIDEVYQNKIAALRAQLAQAQAERDRLREAYATETQRLQARIRTLEEYSAGNVWHWSAMDENHVESLTCPILISAEDMRAALKGEGG